MPAFVDFLIRRDGVEKFVRLYNGSREDRFGAVVRAVYGAELDALEAEHIRRVLIATTTMEQAAGLLGIDTSTLYRKRKRYGL